MRLRQRKLLLAAALASGATACSALLGIDDVAYGPPVVDSGADDDRRDAAPPDASTGDADATDPPRPPGSTAPG